MRARVAAVMLAVVVASSCGGLGQQCEPIGSTLNCSSLQACCTGSTCWYDAVRGGTSRRFSCGANADCGSAASSAVAFCR